MQLTTLEPVVCIRRIKKIAVDKVGGYWASYANERIQEARKDWLSLHHVGGSGAHVKAVQVHDLVPGGNKVMDESFFGIVGGIDLGNGP